MESKSDAVLVIGAGVSGIRVSLDLAEMGRKVYLCDRNPNIGGTLVQLDKWFPDNHCGMCKMLPIFSRDDSSQFCLRRGLVHPNIEILSRTELAKIDGEAGAFTATLRSVPTGIKQDLCIGCGFCAQVCPVEVDDDFDEGLVKRKAIFLRNPWQPASSYVIDWETCTRCGACVEECPTQAIDLTERESEKQVEVGAVVLSTGFEEFDPESAGQYGRGKKKVKTRVTTVAPTKNRVRLRWGKTARYRYMSHLNIMRAVERALRRAGVPVAYSSVCFPMI